MRILIGIVAAGLIGAGINKFHKTVSYTDFKSGKKSNWDRFQQFDWVANWFKNSFPAARSDKGLGWQPKRDI